MGQQNQNKIIRKLKSKKSIWLVIVFILIIAVVFSFFVYQKNHLNIYNSNILGIENALVNNHKIILSLDDFNKIYPKINSTKTDAWDCGSPFEWLDKEWMTKTYGNKNEETGTFDNFNGKITTIYGDNIEFASDNHIVLFQSAKAENNIFMIKSPEITLDKNTTLENFQKIFPKVEKEILKNPNEVRFRFYLGPEEGGAFLFYFKNGKLDYLTLWWQLC